MAVDLALTRRFRCFFGPRTILPAARAGRQGAQASALQSSRALGLHAAAAGACCVAEAVIRWKALPAGHHAPPLPPASELHSIRQWLEGLVSPIRVLIGVESRWGPA